MIHQHLPSIEGCIEIQAVLFGPNQTVQLVCSRIPKQYERSYNEIIRSGCRLTLDPISSTNELVICIEHPQYGEYDEYIADMNRYYESEQEFYDFIGRFKINEFRLWKREKLENHRAS
jgi:hypothetical protein